MGLDSFLEDKHHDNPILDKEKLHTPEICPTCGEKSEHLRGREYRCTNDCEVLYYFAVDFDKNNA